MITRFETLKNVFSFTNVQSQVTLAAGTTFNLPSYFHDYQVSRHMGKPTICICENKDADQLSGNREAYQRLCFRYTDSTLALLLKYEISSFQPASVTVQPDLCRTCSETKLLVFPQDGSSNTRSRDNVYSL